MRRHLTIYVLALSFVLALTAKALAEDPADQLVLHLIAPHVTDPAIDRALDDHYVWLDPARTNHKLLVFMPGTGASPALYQLVQQEAARLGVIGEDDSDREERKAEDRWKPVC